MHYGGVGGRGLCGEEAIEQRDLPGGVMSRRSGLGEQGGYWRHGSLVFEGEGSLGDGIESGGGELGDGVWPGPENEGLDEILGDLVWDLPSTTTPQPLVNPPTANTNEPGLQSEPDNGGNLSLWQETPAAALNFNGFNSASDQTAIDLSFGDSSPFDSLASYDHWGTQVWSQSPSGAPINSKANPGGGSIGLVTCAKYNDVSQDSIRLR